jgi:SAM-dependent methyltransferase
MSSPTDLAAAEAGQGTAWSHGSHAVLGATFQIVGEALCEALDLQAGARVLDVAAGSGNVTLAAARRWCDVTSTDWVPAWLEVGRQRAQAEGQLVRFQEAHAEALPFAEASFEVVMSSFGVMFAPDHRRAARELARVCVPGGKIGLASWTPDSLIGQVIETIGRYTPASPGPPLPVWGTAAGLGELFVGRAEETRTTEREFVFRYRSPLHWLEVFRTYYAPLNRTFAALDSGRQAALTRDLIDLLEQANRSRHRTLVVPCRYLEAVIVKR